MTCPSTAAPPGTPTPDTLTPWILAVAAGDADALTTLHARTHRLVYGVCQRILRRPDEADEVVMDVYAQVWRSADRFHPGRGTGEAWLRMMARSRALDRLRTRRARPDVTSAVRCDDAFGRTIPDTRRHDFANVVDARRLTTAGLRLLAPAERRLLRLAFVDGYSHGELSRVLNLPLGTVKTRVRTSLHKMRRALAPPHRPRAAQPAVRLRPRPDAAAEAARMQ